MDYRTKKSTRIVIWIIAIVMVGGVIGSYMLIILSSQQPPATQTQLEEPATEQPQGSPDPTAYKVEGDVTELQITDLTTGEGEPVKVGDTIRVHYKGTFAQSGVKFDSSFDRGEPATFVLKEPTQEDPQGIIKGWVQGIEGMKAGGKRRVVMPAELAYGEQGTQGIPPNTDLVFEVELLAINPTQ